MLRGIYTAASGMIAAQNRMDTLSNNLANVDTEAFKRDITVDKAFPELLIRRVQDDGVFGLPPSGQFPLLGSIDVAPVVGRLGTGVETNEIYTDFEQGSLEQTDNPFDFALEDRGFFVVQTPDGERLTRNGSFHLGVEGLLVTKEGFPVLGENGPIQLKVNNFRVESDGTIYYNPLLQDDPRRLIASGENQWEEIEILDRMRVVDVDQPRYLRKQGSSLYLETRESGASTELEGTERPTVRQGFLETANVNPVRSMVEMISVNRSYEANQRVIRAQEDATDRLINQVMILR